MVSRKHLSSELIPQKKKKAKENLPIQEVGPGSHLKLVSSNWHRSGVFATCDNNCDSFHIYPV